MVKILTSHHQIWHPERVATAIIKEYQTYGQCVIDLNAEGPCADTIGLYRLLDDICKQFDFDPKNIKILTSNGQEPSGRYPVIVRNNDHWFPSTIAAYKNLPTLGPKNFSKLFGCLYNVPSWDRLCLLSYVWRTSQHSNFLACNGVWEPDKYNTYYLNTLIDHAPNELLNVAQYLQTAPKPAMSDTAAGKPATAEHTMQVWSFYQDFFVDIVAESYNIGLSFFSTEKTLRPMLALTPFIVNAPRGYLSILKYDYGFKTFSAWWDESYDEFQGYERIQKIYQLISQLDTLEPLQWQQMYEEMIPTLEYNKQHLLNYEQR